jgi:hypothetical protein
MGKDAADRGLSQGRPVSGERVASNTERRQGWLRTSAAHSAVAVIDRAPASTPAAARARTLTTG